MDACPFVSARMRLPAVEFVMSTFPGLLSRKEMWKSILENKKREIMTFFSHWRKRIPNAILLVYPNIDSCSFLKPNTQNWFSLYTTTNRRGREIWLISWSRFFFQPCFLFRRRNIFECRFFHIQKKNKIKYRLGNCLTTSVSFLIG